MSEQVHEFVDNNCIWNILHIKLLSNNKKKFEFSPKGHGGRNNFMIGHVKLYKDIQNIFFFDEQNGFGFLNQQLNTKAIQ